MHLDKSHFITEKKDEEKVVDLAVKSEYDKLRKELKKYILKLEYIDMYGQKHIKEKDLSVIYGEQRRIPHEECENKALEDS